MLLKSGNDRNNGSHDIFFEQKAVYPKTLSGVNPIVRGAGFVIFSTLKSSGLMDEKISRPPLRVCLYFAGIKMGRDCSDNCYATGASFSGFQTCHFLLLLAPHCHAETEDNRLPLQSSFPFLSKCKALFPRLLRMTRPKVAVQQIVLPTSHCIP